MARLTGKRALVTGGASGIGRAACRTLAGEGARVMVADIDAAGSAKTVADIGEAAASVSLDVTDEAQWQAAVAETVAQFGGLDILVNCAGIGFAGDFWDTTLEDWNRIIAVNLTGTFLGCKHAVGAMGKSGGGSIVNLSSIAGVLGGEDIAAYSATKGGVTMLTKSVALNCAGKGLNIRCNSIHPTYVDSEMLDPVAEMFASREVMLAGMAELVPLGRVAVPQDVADMILFLASDESAMVTGSAMLLDGGQTAGLPSRHVD